MYIPVIPPNEKQSNLSESKIDLSKRNYLLDIFSEAVSAAVFQQIKRIVNVCIYE